MKNKIRLFGGYRYYMLPANANEGAQGEQRYLSIMNTGWDPELRKQYYECEFTGGDGSIFERQKELGALKFGQQTCLGQAPTAIASCMMQVYNQLPSDSGPPVTIRFGALRQSRTSARIERSISIVNIFSILTEPELHSLMNSN